MAINSINQTNNFFGIDRSRIKSNLGEGEVQSINTSESSFAKNAMNIIEERYSANISSAKAAGAEENITRKNDNKEEKNYSQLDVNKILLSSALYKKIAGIEDDILQENQEIKNKTNIESKEENTDLSNVLYEKEKNSSFNKQNNSFQNNDDKYISADQILKDYYLL